MENQKVQKSFIQKHKATLVVVGGGILGVACAYAGWNVYKKIFMHGAKVGAYISFQETINWFDKEFPDIKLRELYSNWEKLNPDKIIGLKDIL